MVYSLSMTTRFQKVSDILTNLMKGYGLSAKTHEYKILKTWGTTVGDKISSHTQPSRLIRGVLTVDVDSPAWIHQLTFYKEDLIKKINNEIGKGMVKDIRFKVGKVEGKRDAGLKTQASRPRTEILAIEPKVEGYLEPIKDNEVRKAVRKAITKAMLSGKR